ncbi:T9SS type A sorting domain-containing protein [Flavobacterium reichenbachii]|uniref:Secretion protein n=1 Tax=Flavobacterium reichenbachii TaxID=362418 RepID=A0A085ZNQ1_9FLAO|nr:DUF3244 domain-containing protein [Flavobacterium reichenbachii]KFF06065.1 secretion protein [Flavobacterium reichenbachii]OXB14710.1 T9SS C-terminal target domain-containing protein [Flavobacterium reichenbachii]
MKKTFKMSLAAAILFSGISAYAIDGNADLNVQVLKATGKRITFALNQIKKANLTIYDEEGTLIYSESASGKDGILRTFSLEEFPEGTYFLEVEDNVKKVRHEITIVNNSSVLSRKAISSVYKDGFTKNSSIAVR